MEFNKEQENHAGNDASTEEKPAQFEALMAFLDADTYEEKLEILYRMQLDLNDYLIDTMAVSIDVVIPDGDIDERYRQLKGCLQAKQKYEINRFR
ncbi:MAG: hypothetical protein MSA09_11745 [Lachnospiraceae bacterium]|nr:hypothetical protein [Lachnospiraceae bacterium]MDD7176756.1 hypothetical protein [bacterium]MDY5516015.1 hypothetical protein [Lachnospiraceae bacterium]